MASKDINGGRKSGAPLNDGERSPKNTVDSSRNPAPGFRNPASSQDAGRGAPAASQNVRPGNPASSQDVRPGNPASLREAEHQDTGFLKVSVHTGHNALPVPQAAVTVISDQRDENGSQRVYHLLTDRDGNAPVLELPLDIAEHSPNPYAEFNYFTLRVFHESYYPVEIHHVEVYRGHTSIISVALIPMQESQDSNAGAIDYYIYDASPRM